MRQLSQSLAANLAVLDKMFGTSADYYAKEITIYHCRGSILLFDSMARHRRGHRPVYGAGAGGVCVTRKNARPQNLLAPSARGLRPQAVGERT